MFEKLEFEFPIRQLFRERENDLSAFFLNYQEQFLCKTFYLKLQLEQVPFKWKLSLANIS